MAPQNAEAQTNPKSLRHQWDMIFIGLLCLAVFYGMVSWSPMAGYEHRPAAPEGVKKATVECLSGNCWLRPQGGLMLHRIAPHSPIEAYLGDEAMTLGKDSGLVINFKDDAGELRLSNTSIIRIGIGQRTVSLDDKNEGGASASSFTAPPADVGSLIYVGEIPVKFVSPVADSPIIATSFPMSLHLAFILEKGKAEDFGKLSEWSAVDITEERAPRRVSTVKIEHSEAKGGGTAFYGELSIPQPGLYSLLPASMPLAMKNLRFRFEVKSGDSLQDQIHSLLQGVSSDSNRQIEIRSK